MAAVPPDGHHNAPTRHPTASVEASRSQTVGRNPFQNQAESVPTLVQGNPLTSVFVIPHIRYEGGAGA